VTDDARVKAFMPDVPSKLAGCQVHRQLLDSSHPGGWQVTSLYNILVPSTAGAQWELPEGYLA
jgi:hypothetical protein